ncbi:MAG: TonB-dependent receptor [Cyclobacteriaceae bacterium]
MKYFYSTALVFLAILHIAAAQNGKVIGTISDGQSALEYATISIYNEKDSTLIGGTVSDTSGKFELSNLPAGNSYLKAQFIGYDPQFVSSVSIQKGNTSDVGAIVLAMNQKVLNEIEVKGDKLTTINKIDRQVYAAESFAAAKGGTATDVIRNMPAVNVNANGEITVRGSSNFVVLLNGKPVQSSPEMILNQLPANSVENVEIITAPSAKYDPEGKAGIINILTKTGATDGLFLQFNTKLGMPSIEDYDNPKNAPRYGGDFSLNYHKNKWDVSAGASYIRNDIAGRREGDVWTEIGGIRYQFPSDGERSFDETNFSGRFTLGYNPNKNNSLNVGFFGGKRNKERLADIVYYDNRAFPINDPGNTLHEIQYYNHNLRIRRGDFVLGSVDYKHVFESKSELSTSLLYEYTLLGGPTENFNESWPDLNTRFQDERNSNDNPLYGTRFNLDYKSKPLSIGTIEAGYQFRHLDHTGDFEYMRRVGKTGPFQDVPEFSSFVSLDRKIHSVYTQLSGQLGKWSYGAGIRLESMDRELLLDNKTGAAPELLAYDFVKPFPSANLQYAVNDELKIKAAYSRRIQRTTTFKMNPFPEREHSETLEQGDKNLLPEFVDVVELGIVKDFGENSVFATGYFRNTQNLINRVNTVYNDSILNRIYSNVGSGSSLGLEIGTELSIADWWKVFAGANIYKYKIEGQFVFDPVFNQDAVIPVNTSASIYSINANTTFKLSPSMTLQWTLNYISDRNTAQGEDSRYLSPNLTLKKSWLDGRLTATAQWLNMDMGLWAANEQRISTWGSDFYTTTNYVYEVDVIMLNLSYTINRSGKKARFIKSEFGAKEF